MRLSECQKRWVDQVLRKARIDDRRVARRLGRAVGLSIELWRCELDANAWVADDDRQLSELRELVEECDPPIGQIRARALSVSPRVRLRLLRAAHQLWPALVARREGDLEVWARTRRPDRLVADLRKALRRLDRLRPLGPAQPYADEIRLVAYLAADWAWATGQASAPGLTEGPFRDLVHHVFSWVTRKKADTAIRLYGACVGSGSVQRSRKRVIAHWFAHKDMGRRGMGIPITPKVRLLPAHSEMVSTPAPALGPGTQQTGPRGMRAGGVHDGQDFG